MFDHIGIVVSNLEVGRAFYQATLEPLGIQLLENNTRGENEGWFVFGTPGRFPFFVVGAGRPSFWREGHAPSKSPIHLAFWAPSVASVDSFYKGGLAHGGVDNGPPGPRRSSTPNYSAFLLDPDGNNVEADYRGAP